MILLVDDYDVIDGEDLRPATGEADLDAHPPDARALARLLVIPVAAQQDHRVTVPGHSENGLIWSKTIKVTVSLQTRIGTFVMV